MPDQSIVKILNKYGFESVRLLPVQKGYRNESHPVKLKNGDTINLIIYKAERDILKKIKAANSVSDYLFSKNFPVRKLINDRIIKLQFANSIKYCAAYNYLPGQTIPWEAYTMKHLKLLGAMFSDVHFELAKFKTTKDIQLAREIYPDLIKRITEYFRENGVKSSLKKKLDLRVNFEALETLAAILNLAVDLPNQQVLHLDYVRGNVLFKNNPDGELKLSGVLDFEKTAVGSTQFDVARTLAFLLVDCKYKTEAKIRKYFLASGYNKRGKTTFTPLIVSYGGKSIDLFEELINFYLIYDIYKFLLHNPYESLYENDHFKRTLALLLSRCNVIKTI